MCKPTCPSPPSLGKGILFIPSSIIVIFVALDVLGEGLKNLFELQW
jgi:hypothetical protein